MTINTQKLRNFIDSLDANKTPLAVILALSESVDAIDAQTAEIAEAKGQIEQLDRQNEALRQSLSDCIHSLETAKNHIASGRPHDDDPDAFAWDNYQLSIIRARAALSGESKC